MRILLNVREAAEYIGLKKPTLDRWRCEGQGPQFIKTGRRVSYEQDELDRWIDQNRHSSTAAYASAQANDDELAA